MGLSESHRMPERRDRRIERRAPQMDKVAQLQKRRSRGKVTAKEKLSHNSCLGIS